MKRLMKEADFYASFTRNQKYYEIFVNPSSSEIDSIKKQFDRCIRGVIYSDGTTYIWPGYVIHNDINEYINNDIDVEQFRFSYEPNYWIFDAARSFSYQEMKDKIVEHRSMLSRFGNIDTPMNIYFTTELDFYRTSLKEIEEEARNEKTAILKHAQFLDGMMKGKEMVEIYINPTYKEFDICAKSNDLTAVRITFCPDGGVYTWNGEVFHSFIKGQHPECCNGLHAVYIREDNELVIYPKSGDSLNDVIGYFATCQPFISQHNMTNAKLEVFTADYGGTKFPEYDNWQTVKDVLDYIDNL